MFINCNCVPNSISLCFSDNCSISHFFEAGNTTMLIHAGFDGYICSLLGVQGYSCGEELGTKINTCSHYVLVTKIQLYSCSFEVQNSTLLIRRC